MIALLVLASLFSGLYLLSAQELYGQAVSAEILLRATDIENYAR